MRANQLTSMPEETPNKKLRFDWVDWLATIAFVGILILAIAHFTQPISTSSTSYVPLQAYDFWVTNSTCLTEETTGAYKGAIYERFLVAVHNRFNETVHFVNASIYVDYIAFVDGSSKPIYSYFIEAGLNDTAVLTFPIDFHISGVYYGQHYENTTVDRAPFYVIIYIIQNDQIQGPFWLHPELAAFPLSVPKC